MIIAHDLSKMTFLKSQIVAGTAAIIVALAVSTMIGADILDSTNFTNCGDPGSAATLRQLRLTPCHLVPCEIIKGTTFVVEIDFNLSEPVDNVTTIVTGLINGAEVRFRGIHEDSCLDITDSDSLAKVDCPLVDTNRNYTYKANLRVKDTYPTIDLDVTWKLLTPNNETLVCFKIPAKVVPQSLP